MMTTHNPSTRAADADRETTAQRLNEAHSEGRLDPAEYQERIDRCYKARTLGELDALVSDLPRHPRPEGQPGSWLGRRYAFRGPLVPILLAIIAIAALSGDWHDHWHFPWLAVLLVVFLFSRGRPWRGGRYWRSPSDRL
jgi:hypothetical protein